MPGRMRTRCSAFTPFQASEERYTYIECHTTQYRRTLYLIPILALLLFKVTAPRTAKGRERRDFEEEEDKRR